MRTPIDGACVRADTDEYKEKNKKKTLDAGRMADVRMRCVRTSMKVKKKKRKETYSRFGCGRGHLACGWPCVRMANDKNPIAICSCRCVESPQRCWSDTSCRYWTKISGVASRSGDAEGIGVINPSEKDTPGLHDDTRRLLSERYAEPNRRLAAMLGPGFEMWR